VVLRGFVRLLKRGGKGGKKRSLVKVEEKRKKQ